VKTHYSTINECLQSRVLHGFQSKLQRSPLSPLVLLVSGAQLINNARRQRCPSRGTDWLIVSPPACGAHWMFFLFFFGREITVSCHDETRPESAEWASSKSLEPRATWGHEEQAPPRGPPTPARRLGPKNMAWAPVCVCVCYGLDTLLTAEKQQMVKKKKVTIVLL